MMHIVLERQNGRFQSNCNILSLAWLPYYDETRFRQALFEHHRHQLGQLRVSFANQQHQLDDATNRLNLSPANRRTNTTSQHNADTSQVGALRRETERQTHRARQQAGNNNNNNDMQSLDRRRFLTNELAELYHRYLSCATFDRATLSDAAAQPTLLDADLDSQPRIAVQRTQVHTPQSPEAIANKLDTKYGRMREFGWLALGNVGRAVGVTLTSTAKARAGAQNARPNNANSADLIQFNVDDDDNVVDGGNAAAQSCGGTTSAQSDATEFERMRPDKANVRQNYNLRAHEHEVILVKWNELYQKLATVDSKGNVLIWHKINDKFSIQTPFYNRTKTVADFSWSNDGKTALICYTDSFILVGSSSGQRHWHSMLNLDEYHITCATWTPNDEQLLLGVSNGNVVVIDLAHSELTEFEHRSVNIRAMCWSPASLRAFTSARTGSAPSTLVSQSETMPFVHPELAPSRQVSFEQQVSAAEDISSGPGGMRRNSSVVSHRRLSQNCSMFTRHLFNDCDASPSQNGRRRQQSRAARNFPPQVPARAGASTNQQRPVNTLAIDFADNTILLFKGGLDDAKPRTLHTQLESYVMQWSSDGCLLAVAGFNMHTSAPLAGYLRYRYINELRFYSNKGTLVHRKRLPHTRYPITALTWAHDDSRLFIAVGPRLICAKVFYGVASLGQLATACIHAHTKLPRKNDIIESRAHTTAFLERLRMWQSDKCPVNLHADLSLTVKPSPAKKKSTTQSHLDVGVGDAHNSLVYQCGLPPKLQAKVDELFAPTIRQPYDERWAPSDIVWRVPREGQRHYCTLVCYTSERELSANGYQYRAEQSAPGSQQTSSNAQSLDTTSSHSTEQYKIFVLYVEFLGSLIPILRARRVGVLKPEFVIFEPDDVELGRRRLGKVSDIVLDAFRLKERQPRPTMNDACDILHSGQSGDKQHLTVLPPSNGLANTLSESKQLVRIKSNVWGTKFKVLCDGNSMIRQRVQLATIGYRGSILHLEPRQIFLTMKDLSNYCCLCSLHHHKLGSKYERMHNKMLDWGMSDAAKSLFPDAASPVHRRQSPRQRQHRGETVLVPVGDSLRVAPKLEQHQRYVRASTSMSASATPVNRRAKQRARPKCPAIVSLSSQSRGAPQPLPYDQRDDQRNSLSKNNLADFAFDNQDDVLTLSLSQGDQVRVAMSSLRPMSNDDDDEATTSGCNARQTSKTSGLDELIDSSKTLKSIQAITKMIVDLSSGDEPRPQSPARDACAFVAPEAPVHRPRAPHASVSACSSPARARASRARSRTTRNPQQPAATVPLPPPPPSVPLRRRLSSSAKRLIDGSLRSLYSASGYSNAASDAEPDEREPLMSRRRTIQSHNINRKWLEAGARQQRHQQQAATQSQASTPIKRLADSIRKQSADWLEAAQAGDGFRSQLLQRLRGLADDRGDTTANRPQTHTPARESRRRDENVKKGQKRARSSLNDRSSAPHGATSLMSATSDESDDDSELDSSDFEDEDHRSDKKLGGAWSSVRDLHESRTESRRAAIEACRTHVKRTSHEILTKRRRYKRKSVCSNAFCCCAKEFKLCNRPPVWNDLSQVYQLDFGGRVTQESAKNLQIDHDGNLVSMMPTRLITTQHCMRCTNHEYYPSTGPAIWKIGQMHLYARLQVPLQRDAGNVDCSRFAHTAPQVIYIPRGYDIRAQIIKFQTIS